MQEAQSPFFSLKMGWYDAASRKVIPLVPVKWDSEPLEIGKPATQEPALSMGCVMYFKLLYKRIRELLKINELGTGPVHIVFSLSRNGIVDILRRNVECIWHFLFIF